MITFSLVKVIFSNHRADSLFWHLQIPQYQHWDIQSYEKKVLLTHNEITLWTGFSLKPQTVFVITLISNANGHKSYFSWLSRSRLTCNSRVMDWAVSYSLYLVNLLLWPEAPLVYSSHLVSIFIVHQTTLSLFCPTHWGLTSCFPQIHQHWTDL